jgi:hypothetical protein
MFYPDTIPVRCNGTRDAGQAPRGAGGRFVSAYGMHVISGPPGSPYRRLVLDRDWHPVGPLNEWYRLRAGVGAPSTRDTYLRVLTPFFGSLLLNEWAWDAEPPLVREFTRAYLQALQGRGFGAPVPVCAGPGAVASQSLGGRPGPARCADHHRSTFVICHVPRIAPRREPVDVRRKLLRIIPKPMRGRGEAPRPAAPRPRSLIRFAARSLPGRPPACSSDQ